jgi:hypothetical protein
MIALIWFVLAMLAPPFKSKSRLEAENAVLRHQLIVLRRNLKGRARLTNNDRWSFVRMYRWFPTILKIVTIVQPETGRLSPPLAVEIALAGRALANRLRTTYADPADEYEEFALGRAANSRLGGAKLACVRHLRLVRSRIPDRDAAEREVDMFISQKDGRMSHILAIGAAQLGPIQRSGDRASVVQRMLDLIRQARQRVILRD